MNAHFFIMIGESIGMYLVNRYISKYIDYVVDYISTYHYLVDSVRELERSERRRLIFHGIVVSELVVAVLGGSIFSVKKLKCRGGGVMGTTHNLILNTFFLTN